MLEEGVETQEELNVLREMGSDFMQGYFYFKPMAAAAAGEALAAQADRHGPSIAVQ